MLNENIYKEQEKTSFACIEYMKEEEGNSQSDNNCNINKMKNDVEVILEALKEEGYYLVKLKVGDEYICITLDDIIYVRDDFFLAPGGDFITGKIFSANKLNYGDYRYRLEKLSKTKITFLNDGLMIKNYGEPKYNDNKYYHPESVLYIRYDAIMTIKPVERWSYQDKDKNHDVKSLLW
ncbi:hypothetical protein [Clostridium sp. D43t1_170807_H7]|uniref:hypothetical protein n=1 Tax=Clostridium sp. D43t1_170807_H7 TaxID=2787140 RepID=UPI00189A0671|nr:hypothetical protein [Clostridium sp. D43t1_170807_H7]